MPSSVDMDHPSLAAVVKARTVGVGISLSRLHTGDFAISILDGSNRAIIELTPDELRGWLAQAYRTFPDLGVVAPTESHPHVVAPIKD